jgi:3-hydroxyacyl-CoA dehydrogenase/enoyl-CoA hydratase/3-hydroxybutyryl-CoA epimerase/enoyl-CoA isomerase
MLLDGQALRCWMTKQEGFQVAHLELDLQQESINKINALMLQELGEALRLIQKHPVQGLLITSGKESFVVGADITEFSMHFQKSEADLEAWLQQTHVLFSQIENFSFPSVVAINQLALGGGFELALCGAYRFLSADGKVGLPEVKLGIFPAWGGTVRLSRLIGAENALEWMTTGNHYTADQALRVGAVDAVMASDQLKEKSLEFLITLMRAPQGGVLDFRWKQKEKRDPIRLNEVEATMVFSSARSAIAAQAGSHYPAPFAVLEVMQRGAFLTQQEALLAEAQGFVRIAKTPQASCLLGNFLNDQWIKKKNKKFLQDALPVKNAAVLGAGIMGGGIAYESASHRVGILMKDVHPKALELGMTEAISLLDKKVSQKKITSLQMGQVLAQIHPTLSYGDFQHADFVVEAVVEQESVKKKVLLEVEAQVKSSAILASNTSTLCISRLAEALARPEQFCGMHFFNPVPKMPLVEIIRGKKSSDQTIATALGYALQMGKVPLVVQDCAGFFVNRVLFAYFNGFMKLVQEGVDFQKIDACMEAWGLPMGPAHLLDVIGMDTACHAQNVMAAEYPDRMKEDRPMAMHLFFDQKRFGQKTSQGFYRYRADSRGRLQKEVDPSSYAILNGSPGKMIPEEQVIDRLLIPLLIECTRCLEEGVIGSPAEADLGLVYGIGFPVFRGGAFRYAEQVGLEQLVQKASRYRELGKLYEMNPLMLQVAGGSGSFYKTFQKQEKVK